MNREVGGAHGEAGPRVTTRRNERADWPFSDVVLELPSATALPERIAMRPNHVRRLVRVLEQAIAEAEAQRD